MLRIWWFIKDDLDGQALDHFDVVSCCVLGRDQAELCSGTRLNAVNVSFEHLIRVGVYGNVHWLAKHHSAYLALFEVGSDPDVSWYYRQKRLANLNERAFFHGLACHPPGFGRVDFRIGEFKFCLFDFRPQLFSSCGRRLGLSLANGHLLGCSIGLRQTTEGFTNTSLCTTYLRLCLSRSLGCRNMRGASLVHLGLSSYNLVARGIELGAGRVCRGDGLVQLLF